MNIGPNFIRIVNDSGLTFPEAFFVLAKALEEDWGVEVSLGSLSKLIALDYIASDLKPSSGAFILLKMLSETTEAIKEDPNFEEFFKTFPLKDPTTGRSIRARRLDCREEFKKCLINYDSQDIIQGARNYVRSVTETKYMKGPLRFLQELLFLDYLDVQQERTYGEDLA